MLEIKKAIFSIKKYLPTQSMISSPCKNTKHPWGEVLYFKWKSTLTRTTEWLSMSLVALQEGGFSLLLLFGVASGKASRNVLTCKFTMNQRGRVIDSAPQTYFRDLVWETIKSRFTWDPKRTQSGLKYQTALKSCFVYMAISLQATSNPSQKLFHLLDNFTAAFFQTIIRFYCACANYSF